MHEDSFISVLVQGCSLQQSIIAPAAKHQTAQNHKHLLVFSCTTSKEQRLADGTAKGQMRVICL